MKESNPSLYRQIQRFPDQTVIIADASFTYRYIDQCIRITVARLHQHGVTPGQCIPVIARHPLWIVVGLLSVMQIGAIAVPVNRKFTPLESADVIRAVQARIVMVDEQTIAQELPALPVLYLHLNAHEIQDCHTGSIQTFQTNPGSCPQSEELQVLSMPVDPTQPALILFTSGSSGLSKAVVRTHDSLNLQARSLSQILSLTPSDVVLCAAMVTHSYGLENLFAAFYSGSRIIIPETVDLKKILHSLVIHCCTVLVGIPHMYKHLPTLREHSSLHLPLRLALSAGEALPVKVNQQFEQYFGIPIAQVYGATEIPSSAVNINIKTNQQYGSTGIPLPGVKIRIEAADDSTTGGEILVKSPFAARAYYHQPEATRRAFNRGWFRTGDLGYIDQSGLLFITGRKKNMINVAGNKVSPEEVAAIFLTLPQIQDVRIYGIPDEQYGEIVAAQVVTRPGASLTEYQLLQALKSRLAHFKIPKKIFFCNQLERTSTGKIKHGSNHNPSKTI